MIECVSLGRAKEDNIPKQKQINGFTNLGDALELSENTGKRLANEGHLLKDASLADQDVEELLLTVGEIAEGSGDSRDLISGGWADAIPLSLERSGRADNVVEAGNDLLQPRKTKPR